MRRFGARVVLVPVLLAACFSVAAQDARYPWEEYDTRISASRSIAAHGPDLFGDQVSLSNGALSFEVTDVSLPGNSTLPVALTRRYAVINHKDYPTTSQEILADWAVVAPNISGSFAPDWISSGTPGNRCSDMAMPPMPSSAHLLSDFWRGLQLEIPGVGGGDLLVAGPDTVQPTDGATYKWVTNDQVHVSCLSSIKNHTGEGFLAIAPDGTKVWFDWMAQYVEPTLESVKVYATSSQPFTNFVSRRRNVLYATRVEDRFGNWVTYTYTNAWNAPAKLTRILASDGRQLTMAYSGAYVSSVSDGTRTWQYGYGTTPKGRKTLTQVTLPDSSTWSLSLAQLTDAEIEANELAVGEPYRMCTVLELPPNFDAQPVGTVTHPSGAIGQFTLFIQEHGLSNVPVSCGNVSDQNDPVDDINYSPISYNAFTLKQKQVTGPGLTAATWDYSYPGSRKSVYFPDAEGSMQYPICNDGPSCYAPNPVCAPTCEGSIQTVVKGPEDTWSRYTYGNSYQYNVGKLLKVERGAQVGTNPAQVLEVVEHDYDFTQADQQYPASFGHSFQVNEEGFADTFHRPLVSTQTTRQGETFTWEVRQGGCNGGQWCFDALAQPTTAIRHSTLGFSRTEATTYHTDLDDWVVGQVDTVTCVTAIPSTNCSNTVMSDTDYDPQLGYPTAIKAFGKLQYTLTYNADGTLATYKDGRNNITTLSNWYRGVPRLIAYPGSVSQSATVNPSGTIASTTDENGFKTCYAYDAIGRLSQVTYPSETQAGVCDTSAWNPTTQSFVQVGGTEFGIGAGHWRQTVATGNGVKTQYFDALWRPLVVREFESGKLAATQRFTRLAYDAAGRTTFVSYPGTTNNLTAGTRTDYDALGRVARVEEDSEPGILVTSTAYPATSFQTVVTNPRGFTTTTDFRALDTPATDAPVLIDHPEGAVTQITRDAFGKPRTITRTNDAGTAGVARQYVYDTAMQLCKTIEPETGATVMAYDAAGNLAWSASGQALPDAASCDLALVPAGEKVLRTYDTRNRTQTLRFPGEGGGSLDQDWVYTPDGLPAQVTTWNGANHTLAVINAYDYNSRRMLGGQGESISQGTWYTWSLGYGYDRNGHVANHVYPTGLVVDYAPNALGQATKAGTFASGASYYPNGALEQFTYGNGLVHTTTQNLRGLPARVLDEHPTTEVRLLDETLYYDSNANVLAITDGATGRNQRGNRDLTYDGLDRLKTAVSPMWNGTASYAYDVLDNLTRVTVPATATAAARDHWYCYDGSNRLTNVKTGGCGGTTVIGLGYDVRGNLANKNGQAYGFDYGNRLRSVTGVEHYRYDALGRRVLSWSPTLGNILSQYDRAGRLVYQHDERIHKGVAHVYLGNRLVAKRERDLPGSSNPVVTYLHTDALGSVAVTSNAAGTEAQRSEYEPYGKLANRVNDNRPGHTGHVMDAETGLTYMQQRYYDPGIGMFLSVDPVTAYSNPVGQFHRYSYANNNPYKFRDPDGRQVRNINEPPGVPKDGCNGAPFCVPRSQMQASDSSEEAVPEQVSTAVVATDTALTAQGIFSPKAQGQFVTGNAAMSQWKGPSLSQVRAARQLSALGKVVGAASLGINGANFLAAVATDDLDGMVSSGTGFAFGMGGVTTVGAPGALTYSATSLLLQFPAAYDAAVTTPLDYHGPAIQETVDFTCAVMEC